MTHLGKKYIGYKCYWRKQMHSMTVPISLVCNKVLLLGNWMIMKLCKDQ